MTCLEKQARFEQQVWVLLEAASPNLSSTYLKRFFNFVVPSRNQQSNPSQKILFVYYLCFLDLIILLTQSNEGCSTSAGVGLVYSDELALAKKYHPSSIIHFRSLKPVEGCRSRS